MDMTLRFGPPRSLFASSASSPSAQQPGPPSLPLPGRWPPRSLASGGSFALGSRLRTFSSLSISSSLSSGSSPIRSRSITNTASNGRRRSAWRSLRMLQRSNLSSLCIFLPCPFSGNPRRICGATRSRRPWQHRLSGRRIPVNSRRPTRRAWRRSPERFPPLRQRLRSRRAPNRSPWAALRWRKMRTWQRRRPLRLGQRMTRWRQHGRRSWRSRLGQRGYRHRRRRPGGARGNRRPLPHLRVRTSWTGDSTISSRRITSRSDSSAAGGCSWRLQITRYASLHLFSLST